MPVRTRPGTPAADAPLRENWLIDRIGNRFQLLAIGTAAPDGLEVDGIPVETLRIDTRDLPTTALLDRYLGESVSAVYLIRPDQHIAARWTTFEESAIRAAVRTAIGMA